MRAVARTMELRERSLNDRERFGFDAPKPLLEVRSEEYRGRVDEVANVNAAMPTRIVSPCSSIRDKIRTEALPKTAERSFGLGILPWDERYAVSVSVRCTGDPSDKCRYRDPRRP